jgi:chemotaxis protein methyltransferase CheR
LYNDKEWDLFKEKLRNKSGINLNDYKPAQMQRRIESLGTRNGATGYLDFFDKVDKDPKLYKTFIDFLTINVTEFFRTPEKFEEMEKKVIPDLLKKSPKLAIWSAGCSTGAEPYSIAIALRDITPNVKHKILATDLDIEMLAKAREGVYSINELKNVSAARLAKYFTKRPDGVTMALDSGLKADIEFKRHNLLEDKFDTGFDLILCRNVVIYFTEEAKDALYRRFYESLKPGGVLFVGGTEAVLNSRAMGYQQYLPFFYRKPM